ncbi:MAG: thiamine pyrophosphate-binding protein [Gemmatimonadales bacterium]
MPAVADHIISRLRDVGVRMLFGVPGGGGNLDLIEAAGRGGLPFVLTATETGGAIAAIAQSEVTGRPGACLTTLGPGAASVVNGVACAYLERAPVFVFTDSYASSDTGAFEHQVLDHRSIFQGITKCSVSLAPGVAHQSLEEAFRAIGERPFGPVHLDCPADYESAREPAVGAAARAAPVGPVPHASGERATLDELLRRARKPLVIVGLGARRPEDAAAIRSFCERRRVPAMVTYKAKGVVPDDHKWWAGVFTNAAIERALVDECDLIIGVGLDPVELLPRRWTHVQPVVYCGPTGIYAKKAGDASGVALPYAVGVESGVVAGLKSVDARLPEPAWDGAHLRERADEQRRAIRIPAAGLSAQRVVEIAAAQLARECRVTVDAGAHMFPATMLWPVYEPNQMLISNGLSTMGFALPAAIGAALVDREHPVVALTGDGGLLMCMGELLTAVRERLRIITIVFSDASLSLIEIKQQARKLAPAGVALDGMDWTSVARGFGMDGFVASDESGLERALEQARSCRGPSLIEARIDRSNYGATLRAVRG